MMFLKMLILRRLLLLVFLRGKFFAQLRASHSNSSIAQSYAFSVSYSDKRMAYAQMSALTGLPTKDEWDFVFNGYSNAPFIKTNYPHSAGVWSWDDGADQVALVVQVSKLMIHCALSIV